MEGDLPVKRVLVAVVLLVSLPLVAQGQTCLHQSWDGRCMTALEYEAWTAWPALPPTPVPDPIPAPVHPAVPVYRGMGSGQVEHYRSMVAYYWGKHGATDRMLRIMRCESGGNPNARNASTDVRGLFQVKYPLWSKQWPGNYYDPWTNAAIAYQVWLEQGFRAWACRG